MKIYNLRELNKLANQVKFNRDTLEKVLRLAELLKLFNAHHKLKNKYVLKGGTAINLCIYDFPRLSVDIDMNFNLDCSKDEMVEVRELHKKIIGEHVALNGYTIHPKSRFTFTLDSYLLQYTNAVGSNDYIKLELNYSNRVQILEPIDYKINSNIVDNTNVLGMNKVELYGSKIAALIGRTTARDVFDVLEMITLKMISDDEMDMLRKCTIFYLLTSNDFQTLDDLINQFKATLNNMTFHNIRRNLIPMLHVGTKIDLDKFKNPVIDFIDELFKSLTTLEKEYIDSFNLGSYKPELLFAFKIAKTMEHHPIALWKMLKYEEKHSNKNN